MISISHFIKNKDNNYYNYLYNKRVAIVGPSSNTYNTKQGEYIDGFDIVVRLNKSLPIPSNRHIDIGSKTNILYNSFNLSDYPGENNLNINIIKNKIDYICSPYPFIYPFIDDILQFMYINNSQINVHIINLILYKYIVSILQCRPYTGTCAIIDLLQYPIKELYITGIDCYLCKYYNEYRRISKAQLLRQQNNNIHKNGTQLELIKKLCLNDNRIKIDLFLENYLFKKEYIIYKNILSTNNIFNILKGNDLLVTDKQVVYSNNYYINYNNISDSLNYYHLYKKSDVIFNFNNNNTSKEVKVNNDLNFLFDFNNNKKFIQSILNNTDIKNISVINYNSIHKFQKFSYFKNLNFRSIIIFILLSTINKIIYISNKLIKDLSKEEYNFILYLQFKKKINIFKE